MTALLELVGRAQAGEPCADDHDIEWNARLRHRRERAEGGGRGDAAAQGRQAQQELTTGQRGH